MAKNKDKRFIVCCNDLEIEALGTTFDVKGYCDDHSVTTLLAEGSVKVSNKTDVTLLKPGEKVEYHKNKQTFTKSPISDMREIDFWRNNMLIFNSSSLAEIATTLERMYGVKVVFDILFFRPEALLKNAEELPHSLMIEMRKIGNGDNPEIGGGLPFCLRREHGHVMSAPMRRFRDSEQTVPHPVFRNHPEQ